MSIAPLIIENKENHPDKVIALQGVLSKYFIDMNEFNGMVAYINSLATFLNENFPTSPPTLQQLLDFSNSANDQSINLFSATATSQLTPYFANFINMETGGNVALDGEGLSASSNGFSVQKIIFENIIESYSLIVRNQPGYIATEAYCDAKLVLAEAYADGLIATLIGASPTDLDTLQEISAALQNNPNVITNIITALANRLRFDINNQGLSSTEKANALANLGIVIADLQNRANHTGTQAISTITGLQTILDTHYRKVLISDNTKYPSSAVNGNSTVPVSLYTNMIPANTFADKECLLFENFVQKYENTATFTSALYFNTTNDFATATQIASVITSGVANRVIALSYHIIFRGTEIEVWTPATHNVSSDENMSVSGTADYQTYSFNRANNIYFWTAIIGNTANTFQQNQIRLTRLPQKTTI
jgi:hypothetical protein